MSRGHTPTAYSAADQTCARRHPARVDRTRSPGTPGPCPAGSGASRPSLSLLEGAGVDLGDVMTGADPVHRYLILVALAHAGGDRTAWAAASS